MVTIEDDDDLPARLQEVFSAVGVTGQVCVRAGDGTAETALDADVPVVAASVIKVIIALAAQRGFADGTLDPTTRVRLPAAGRTPGPVGFSLYRDDVELSLRDLVVAALTISDNPAADALLHRVGLDTCAELIAELGLTRTVIIGDLATMIDLMATDAGFTDWASLDRWSPDSPADAAAVGARIRASAALDPARASRTTARDLCRLVEAVWRDEAGPPEACARVRELMGHQLTRQRLASGVAADVRVAAKSGGLMGVVRHEVGVITLPDRRWYAAAVCTTTPDPAGGQPGDGRRIDAAIGRAAALAVSALSGTPSPAPRR